MCVSVDAVASNHFCAWRIDLGGVLGVGVKNGWIAKSFSRFTSTRVLLPELVNIAVLEFAMVKAKVTGNLRRTGPTEDPVLS